jgi:hypothetical protein
MEFVIPFFVAIWLLAIILLHFLKPDFTPYNHTCSEYAIGKFGFIMNIAFFSMATANILLAFSFIQKNNIFIGVLFGFIALGFIGLGIFRADLTISDTPETTTGKIHLLFGFIAMLTINVLSFVLAGKEKTDIALWILASICVASFIVFVISSNIEAPVFFGIAQRIYISILTIWFLYIAIKLDVFNAVVEVKLRK